MGEADRYYEYKNMKPRFSVFGKGNAVIALFVINIVFFLILFTIQVAFSFYGRTISDFYAEMVSWFTLPPLLKTLSEKPWTILTYMFVDYSSNLMNLISNMLWLWAFGSIMQNMSGNNKIIPVYIYGGLTGALFFILGCYFIPASGNQMQVYPLYGANAAVISVAAATVSLSPNYRILQHIRKGVPLWILLIVYAFIDLAGVSGLPTAFALSHIGGALAGFLFVILIRKGWDGSIWMNKFYKAARDLFTPSQFKKPEKDLIYYDTGKRKPFERSSNITQQRVDEILDKINQKGYHFLTEEEKEILRKAAEENL